MISLPVQGINIMKNKEALLMRWNRSKLIQVHEALRYKLCIQMRKSFEFQALLPHRLMRAYGLKYMPGNGSLLQEYRGGERIRSRSALRVLKAGKITCTCYLRIFSFMKVKALK